MIQFVGFHATRTVQTNRFENGILPLKLIIENIWSFLFSLVKSEISRIEWDAFKAKMGSSHSAWLYGFKLNNADLDGGPFAFLIRDVIFQSDELGHHNYFRTPEIVEDICNCFEERFEIDLLKIFQSKTRPCIVKFVDYNPDSNLIHYVLYYLYCKYHSLSLDGANTHYVGNGVNKVEKRDIINIEFMK